LTDVAHAAWPAGLRVIRQRPRGRARFRDVHAVAEVRGEEDRDEGIAQRLLVPHPVVPAELVIRTSSPWALAWAAWQDKLRGACGGDAMLRVPGNPRPIAAHVPGVPACEQRGAVHGCSGRIATFVAENPVVAQDLLATVSRLGGLLPGR
jgi:hypothetical protein